MEVTENFAGITLPGHLHTQESLHAAATFQFRDTDVVIVTYPKSGESRGWGSGCCVGGRTLQGYAGAGFGGSARCKGAWTTRLPGISEPPAPGSAARAGPQLLSGLPRG